MIVFNIATNPLLFNVQRKSFIFNIIHFYQNEFLNPVVKHDNFTLIIFDYIKISNEVKSENVNWKALEKIPSQKKLFSFIWKVKITETENFTNWDKLKLKNRARWT